MVVIITNISIQHNNAFDLITQLISFIRQGSATLRGWQNLNECWTEKCFFFLWTIKIIHNLYNYCLFGFIDHSSKFFTFSPKLS